MMLPEEYEVMILAELSRRNADGERRRRALKWSRFYYDFCEKCGHSLIGDGGPRAFSTKLEEKRQAPELRAEAGKVVLWYRRLLEECGSGKPGLQHEAGCVVENLRQEPLGTQGPVGRGAQKRGVSNQEPRARRPVVAEGRGQPIPGVAEGRAAAAGGKGGEAQQRMEGVESWDAAIRRLEVVLRTRRCAKGTLATYRSWVWKFRKFLGEEQDLRELAPPEASRFIEHLALEGRVAASSQSQAFNALLFL